MVTDKLAKEFEKIRASLAKSKKLILADIDKIDEKYRRLAQEEKKSLTEKKKKTSLLSLLTEKYRMKRSERQLKSRTTKFSQLND